MVVELPPEIKDANRAAAARIPRVLELAGLYVVPDENNTGTDPEICAIIEQNLELLAEAEHEEWMRYMRANGWRYGTEPKSEADKQAAKKAKLNPNMVSYDKLPDSVKNYDRKQVCSYPTILVAFSPDGRRIASGSDDKTVRVWDAAGGAELACLTGHETSVNSVAFSPDGTRIASGSGLPFGDSDNTVRVWDAASGTELACLTGHEEGVKSVAFSPDGRRIASGSDDKTVRVWDAETGECLQVIEGRGDVAAIAAGEKFPLRAVRSLNPLHRPPSPGCGLC